MLVYRIQRKDDKMGVYYKEHNDYEIERLTSKLRNAHGYGEERPGVRTDFNNWSRDYICGFDSLDKLKWWFDGFIETFNQLSDKIELAVYRAKDVLESHSGKQVGFLRKTARKVKTIKFCELLECNAG